MPRLTPRKRGRSRAVPGAAVLPPRRCAQKRGPHMGALSTDRTGAEPQDFVAGVTPGLSLKNVLFSSMKLFH